MAINMSIKFEDSYRALDQCIEAISSGEYPATDSELYYFVQMIKIMAEFLSENGLLDDDGYLDSEALEDYCGVLHPS